MGALRWVVTSLWVIQQCHDIEQEDKKNIEKKDRKQERKQENKKEFSTLSMRHVKWVADLLVYDGWMDERIGLDGWICIDLWSLL